MFHHHAVCRNPPRYLLHAYSILVPLCLVQQQHRRTVERTTKSLSSPSLCSHSPSEIEQAPWLRRPGQLSPTRLLPATSSLARSSKPRFSALICAPPGSSSTPCNASFLCHPSALGPRRRRLLPRGSRGSICIKQQDPLRSSYRMYAWSTCI